jgi:hypothetical protein
MLSAIKPKMSTRTAKTTRRAISRHRSRSPKRRYIRRIPLTIHMQPLPLMTAR